MSSKANEEAALEVIRRHAEGVSDDALVRELGSRLSAQERMQAINKLLSSKRIQLYQVGPNKTTFYKELSAEESAKYKGLAADELMVYQTIQSSGSAGLWTKDMKTRTNLAQPHITKILKVLEGRRLVKAVKSVNNPSRKVYMLAELEPSRELTGGAWYTDNQFDHDFIETLRAVVKSFILKRGDTTLRQIAAHIKAQPAITVSLADEDIGMIIQTLVYDGTIDTVEGDDPDDSEEHYRPMLYAAPETTPFTNLPCGVCPVFHQCRDGGPVSPATCVYFDKWLQF
ncbi:RNA polymerase Rpc34 subunit-domain-containing protein [Haematococcus lacustris]